MYVPKFLLEILVLIQVAMAYVMNPPNTNGIYLELYLFKLAHYFWRQVDHACLSNPAWYINLQYFSKLAQYFC